MASIEIQLGDLKNCCFVIMPFDSIFLTEYERVIKPAVEESGLTCVRADEIYAKQHIMSDIWSALRSSRLVIAELTGKKPNVLYETGLAHAIGKPVIIITRNQDDVPFDLKAIRYLHYNAEDPYWGDDLKRELASMIKKVTSEEHDAFVFEGIELKGFSSYLQVSCEEEDMTEFAEVSGKWEGNMTYKENGEGTYDFILDIEQTDNRITGKMIINYIVNEVKSIVEQNMIGTIIGEKLAMHGVTVTFIEQGASAAYSPDNLTLLISEDGNEMEGPIISMHSGKFYHYGTIFMKKTV